MHDRDGSVRYVVACDRPDAPFAGRPPDDAVGPRQGGEEIHRGVFAHERVAKSGCAYVLLGVLVVPGEREGGLRQSADHRSETVWKPDRPQRLVPATSP